MIKTIMEQTYEHYTGVARTKIISISLKNGKVVYQLQMLDGSKYGGENTPLISEEEFQQIFRPLNNSRNINERIVELIEKGYEFKSFIGETLSGKVQVS